MNPVASKTEFTSLRKEDFSWLNEFCNEIRTIENKHKAEGLAATAIGNDDTRRAKGRMSSSFRYLPSPSSSSSEEEDLLKNHHLDVARGIEDWFPEPEQEERLKRLEEALTNMDQSKHKRPLRRDSGVSDLLDS